MGTAIAERPEERIVEYIPFGETKPIKLTMGLIRSHIAVPTRSGAVPPDSELVKFIMLCQARELNPWVNDAYLVGYDSKNGPKFSIITAIQALLKRAEANPAFDGLESGVIVTAGTEVIERRGNLVLPSEKLVGGWAKCYRKDRAHSFYDSLSLDVFNTNQSQWAKDPAGMIDKCAQASVLRMAFPTQLSGLYIDQERGLMERRELSDEPSERVITSVSGGSKVAESSLNDRRKRAQEPPQEDAPAPPPGISHPPAVPDHLTDHATLIHESQNAEDVEKAWKGIESSLSEFEDVEAMTELRDWKLQELSK